MSRNQNLIKRGTTICTSKPFAHILCSKYRTERCDYCLASANVSKCAGCEYVSYCNKTCQKKGWFLHKKECPNLKRISPKVVPDVARLMARIIIKLDQGGGEEVGYYSETGCRKFKDLMSHRENVKKDEKRMEHFICLCAVLLEFLGNEFIPSSAELMGIYGRIIINSFNIVDMDTNNIGVGIYLGPSVIDHSCKPNAVATFEGTTITIRTIQDLPYLDWSQIRITYIELLDTTKERRANLKNFYYFWCNCKRCEEPEPMAEAAACPNKSCTYPCSPYADRCGYCNTKFPEGFLDKFTEVSDFTAHHIQNMNDIAYWDVSKLCLKKQEGVFHPLNIQHAQTLRVAFEAALTLDYLEKVEEYGKRLLNSLLIYYGEMHPFTGYIYLILGKIQMCSNKPKQALELLKKANVILTTTYGEYHTIIRERLTPVLFQATIEGL